MSKKHDRRTPAPQAMARPLVTPRTPDDWERGWQRTWKELGFVPYELPPDDSPAGQERDFLMNVRSAEGERERLQRIQAEFERGFRALAWASATSPTPRARRSNGSSAPCRRPCARG